MGYANYWRDKAEQLQATLNAECKAHSDALTAKDSELAEARARISKLEDRYENWRAVSESPHPSEIERGVLLNFYRDDDEGTWWNGTWDDRRDADIWCPCVTAFLNDRARTVLSREKEA